MSISQNDFNPAWMAVLPRTAFRQWTREARHCIREWQGRAARRRRVLPEWREGSKRVRLSVGKDPADASARRLRKEAELNAMNNGVMVVPRMAPTDERLASCSAQSSGKRSVVISP